MANEKHDPWALLREALAHMRNPFLLSGLGFAQLKERIGAALAAQDIKPDSVDIKWQEKEMNRLGIVSFEADYSDDVFLTAEPHWLRSGWLWRVERAGYAKDEAEAKAKAIEYAERLP